MSGPWEDYQTEAGPWADYAAPKAAPRRPTVAEDAKEGLVSPWRNLFADAADEYRRRSTPKVPGSIGEAARDTVDDLAAAPRMVGNLFAAATSPIQAAVKPAVRALNSLPARPYTQDNPFAKPRPMQGEEAQAALEGDVNTALSAARPGPLKYGPTRPPIKAAPRAPAKNLDQLKAEKTAAYKAVDASGINYKPEAFKELFENTARAMDEEGFNAGLHPKAAAMMERIGSSQRGAAGHSPTITQLDQLRQQIGRDVAGSPDAGERRMGAIMRAEIDRFMDGAGPDQLAGGEAAGAQTLRNARDLNTRVRKIESVDDAVESARLRAGSTGSGGNVDNATRQNLRRVLEDGRNFTDEERDALESIVMGGKGQNLLRLIGKLSPSGNGLMAAGNLGAAAVGGWLGALPGAAGLVSKLAADGITQRKVAALVRLMAEGGRRPSRQAAPARSRSLLQPRATGPAAAIGVGEVAAPLGRIPSPRESRPAYRRER